MSYDPETALLQLAQLRQELKVSASTYKSDVPHTIKYLLNTVTNPIKLLTWHLQDHLYFIPTPLIHLDLD